MKIIVKKTTKKLFIEDVIKSFEKILLKCLFKKNRLKKNQLIIKNR